MNVLLFLTVSTWEWFALIVLTFALYRFEIRELIGQVTFGAFLLSLVSYMLLNVLKLTLFATFIQPLIVILLFWIVYNVPLVYASFMVINGYLTYLFVICSMYYFVGLFGIQFTPSTFESYIVQSCAGLIILLIVWGMLQYRLGFTFISQNHRVVIPFRRPKGSNLYLLILTVVGYAVISSFNYLYFGAGQTLIVLLAMTIALSLLHYWTLQKEREFSFWQRNRKYDVDRRTNSES